MASKNETVAEIVKEMVDFGNHYAAFGGAYSPECLDRLCRRLTEAHEHEVDSLNFKLMTAKSEQKTAANVIIEQTNKVEKLEREVAELRECLNEAVFVMQTLFDKQMPKWRKALEGEQER